MNCDGEAIVTFVFISRKDGSILPLGFFHFSYVPLQHELLLYLLFSSDNYNILTTPSVHKTS